VFCRADYVPATPEDRQRQVDLKRRIKASGHPVRAYRDPAALAKRLERDLWKLLDAEFPASSVPDAFEREAMRHEAYATPRRRLYLGGERYQAQLAAALEAGEQRIVIEGASGGGKSALLANFFESYRKRHPRHPVQEHYLGASADAGDPHALVRRLVEFIKRHTSSSEEIESDPQKLMDSLPLWLATASAWARKRKTRFVFVLDALNSLTDQQDLRWWPGFLPQGVHFVVSCLTGPVLQALKDKAQGREGQSPRWKGITVKPLSKTERKQLLTTYLARYNKTLPRNLTQQVMAHTLSGNPLFIRTLAEELRIFGVHEELTERLAHYLNSQTIDDLFEKVIERVEGDCGKKAVKATLSAIWASRAGLTEKEILGIADLKPAEWAPIRNALDEALLEADGKITFAHDYVRTAVRDRYLSTEAGQRESHQGLARWFRAQPVDARRAQEEPHQWFQANAWPTLRRALTEFQMFSEVLKSEGELELVRYWNALQRFGVGTPVRAYQRAWRHWQKKASQRQLSTLARLLFLFLYRWGDYKSFPLRLGRASVDLARRLDGPRSQEVAYRLGDLGLLLQEANHLVESKSVALEAADILATCPLASPIDLAAQTSNVARVLQASGEIDESVDAFRRALVLTARSASNDELVAILQNNIAMALHDRGDLKEAREYYCHAMTMIKRVKGKSHPELGIFGKNLACLAQDEGDQEEALSLLAQASKIVSESLGPTHIEKGFCESRMGVSLYRLGEFKRAFDHFNIALEIISRHFSADHPEYLSAVKNLNATSRKLSAK
jgi:tetratricopeptide (TPR) repeat protein